MTTLSNAYIKVIPASFLAVFSWGLVHCGVPTIISTENPYETVESLSNLLNRINMGYEVDAEEDSEESGGMNTGGGGATGLEAEPSEQMRYFRYILTGEARQQFERLRQLEKAKDAADSNKLQNHLQFFFQMGRTLKMRMDGKVEYLDPKNRGYPTNARGTVIYFEATSYLFYTVEMEFERVARRWKISSFRNIDSLDYSAEQFEANPFVGDVVNPDPE